MSYVRKALSENEQVVISVRPHIIVLLLPTVATLASNLIILILARMAQAEEPGLFAPIMSLSVFPLCYFAYRYLTWFNEEYYLTNRRVIQSEGIINKRISDSSLEKVNDVVLSQTWLGRVLDYGDVEILTASEAGANTLVMITSPVLFKTAMLTLKDKLRGEDFDHPLSQESESGIPELIASLDRLRKTGVLTEAEFEDKKKQLLARI